VPPRRATLAGRHSGRGPPPPSWAARARA
jgi:hypothetical protein